MSCPKEPDGLWQVHTTTFDTHLALLQHLFLVDFSQIAKKVWFDCGGSSGGFCLCRRENKWFQPQIENSLMPAHN